MHFLQKCLHRLILQNLWFDPHCIKFQIISIKREIALILVRPKTGRDLRSGDIEDYFYIFLTDFDFGSRKGGIEDSFYRLVTNFDFEVGRLKLRTVFIDWC